MRQAKSYSIVDHELLHGGFIARLAHRSLALYLFLCVVGDKNGRSYYGDAAIMRILRLSSPELKTARSELVASRLIEYQRPYYRILNLTKISYSTHASPPRVAHQETVSTSGIVPEALRALIKSLEER
jgi:hypothetical protein